MGWMLLDQRKAKLAMLQAAEDYREHQNPGVAIGRIWDATEGLHINRANLCEALDKLLKGNNVDRAIKLIGAVKDHDMRPWVYLWSFLTVAAIVLSILASLTVGLLGLATDIQVDYWVIGWMWLGPAASVGCLAMGVYASHRLLRRRRPHLRYEPFGDQAGGV